MKIAVFADIHSNFTAFETCVKQAEKEGAQQLLFLGDYVSDCARPREVLDLLYRLQKESPCTVITGNREEYMLARRDGEDGWAQSWTYGTHYGSHLYTYESLREKDFIFFAALPTVARLVLQGQKPILFCHGTPGNTRDALMPQSAEANFWAPKIEEPYVLCGHSHRYVDFACKGKRIINFASTGSPVEGDPRASMGILESDGGDWRFERLLVPYDIEKEIDAFRSTGLSEKANWCASAIAAQLRTGDSYPLRMYERMSELNEKHPSEADWGKVAAELHIPHL